MNDPFFIFAISEWALGNVILVSITVVWLIIIWCRPMWRNYRAAQRRAKEHFDGRAIDPSPTAPDAKTANSERHSSPAGSLKGVIKR